MACVEVQEGDFFQLGISPKEGTWLAIAVRQIASKSPSVKQASLGRRFEKNPSWQLSFAASLLCDHPKAHVGGLSGHLAPGSGGNCHWV